MSMWRTKVFAKEFFAPLLPFFGERDRLRLAHWIEDHSLFIETVHCIPIMAFPSPSVTVECEKQKREHHLVNFVLIIVHTVRMPWRLTNINRAQGELHGTVALNESSSAVRFPRGESPADGKRR